MLPLLSTAAQLVRCSLGHDLAPDEDRHPIADRLHLVEEVAGEQNGHPLVLGEALDQVEHLHHTLGVDGGGGLVEDQHRRAFDQGVGHPKTLLHAREYSPAGWSAASASPTRSSSEPIRSS